MRRAARVLSIVLVSLALLAPVRAGATFTSLIVSLPSGDQVQGIYTGGAAFEWRGIPYAAPPVGNLRWRPPAPPQTGGGLLDATQFAPECLQLLDDSSTVGSEDCLYLNVFVPAGASPADHLPVMVHVHGGGNLAGSPREDADALVRNGVIVVTVGYRLGVMGFVGHPKLTTEGGGSSGEYGLLDQIAALRWVQGNIAAFGGDPQNVTLFGSAAGSYDVVALAASPLARGLFQRVAAQTEAFWPLNGTGKIADAEAVGSKVATAVGCTTAADVLACLRSTSADRLVVATGFQGFDPWVGGRVLPASPLSLIKSATAAVPMLLGSDREEASFWFPNFTPPGNAYTAQDRTQDTKQVFGPQYAKQVRDRYPIDAYGSPFWATIAAISDAAYTCPIRRLALATHAPVYRYLYTHVYVNADPVITAARASHAFDDPLLWDDAFVPFSPAEADLSLTMSRYWTNFAKTGDPNQAGVLPNWAPFTASSPNAQILDTGPISSQGYHNAQCDFLDRIPALQGTAADYTPIKRSQ